MGTFFPLLKKYFYLNARFKNFYKKFLILHGIPLQRLFFNSNFRAIADLKNTINESREEKENCKKQLKERENQLIVLGEEFDQIVKFFKENDNSIKNWV